MSIESFDYIFDQVRGILENNNNNRPDKITSKEKLSMVLEYVYCIIFPRALYHFSHEYFVPRILYKGILHLGICNVILHQVIELGNRPLAE